MSNKAQNMKNDMSYFIRPEVMLMLFRAEEAKLLPPLLSCTYWPADCLHILLWAAFEFFPVAMSCQSQ